MRHMLYIIAICGADTARTAKFNRSVCVATQFALSVQKLSAACELTFLGQPPQIDHAKPETFLVVDSKEECWVAVLVNFVTIMPK